MSASLPIDQAALAQEVVRAAQRSDIAEEVTRFRGPPRALGRADRCRRAVRPQARLPAAGDEPRDQHHRQQGRRHRGLRAHHPSQGRTRADAGAGPECRVGAGCCSSSRRPRAPARRRWSSGWCRSCRTCAMSRSYTSRPARAGERDGVDYHFIGRAAVRGDDRRQRLPRVGGRVRQPLRHGGRRRRPHARRRPGRGAGDRRAGRATGASAGHRSHGGVRDAAVVTRCWSGGCAAAAPTRSRRCSGGSRPPGPRSRAIREYDYVVVNDDLESTVVRLQEIIAAERSRTHRMGRVADAIVRTFFPRTRTERRGSMARIALGVSGGIGAYKAVEVVARPAEGRARRHGGDDAERPALRRRAHLRGASPGGAS